MSEGERVTRPDREHDDKEPTVTNPMDPQLVELSMARREAYDEAQAALSASEAAKKAWLEASATSEAARKAWHQAQGVEKRSVRPIARSMAAATVKLRYEAYQATLPARQAAAEAMNAAMAKSNAAQEAYMAALDAYHVAAGEPTLYR